MTRWRILLAMIGAVIFIATLVIGPYLAAYRATQASIKSAEIAQKQSNGQAELAKLEKAEAGVQTLLNFVAAIQSSPSAKTSREAPKDELDQLHAICVALPGCKPTTPPDGL